MTKLQALENAYFDKLEENLVDFTEVDDAGKQTVKLEYLVSPEEMCDYLGMNQTFKDMALILIEEEENGVVKTPIVLAGSEFSDFAQFSNKQGETIL